jgi:hypothetical protein
LTQALYVLGIFLFFFVVEDRQKKNCVAKMSGVQFPEDSKGQRSSTPVVKAVLSAAIGVCDKDAAQAVESERNFRFGYARHIRKHVELSLKSEQNALSSAKAGLAAMHDAFEFIRDGQVCKLPEAMSKFGDADYFHTATIQGSGALPADGQFFVPYKGENLRGEALARQARAWAEYGTIEPDCAEAIASIALGKEWLGALKGRSFVLLGALAAMGPLRVLLALGAHVVAVDLNVKGIWQRLVEIARASPGSMTFPLSAPESTLADDDALFAAAGANIAERAPEIAAWLATVDTDRQLMIGNYVYIPAALFVRVTVACDAIIQSLCESRRDTAVAFLCTPTDMHRIPAAAHSAARRNGGGGGLFNLAVSPFRFSPVRNLRLVPNVAAPVVADDGTTHVYVNGIVVPQGPNYAISKRSQHWRAIVARSQGARVSSNIAPSTATVSVTQNRSFAWAYSGMPAFVPMEIFQQETSNAVMTALLLNDLVSDQSAANPAVPLSNPLALFSATSFHGGIWRCGYTIDSIGGVSILIHFARVLRPIFVILLALFLAKVFLF